jgi:hypothetical protein
MITPKQQALLNHQKVQLIVAAFQCEPTLSSEYKFSKAVQDRISELVQGYQKAVSLPVVKRSVSKSIEDTTQGYKIDSRPNAESTFTFKAWACLAGKTIKAPF